MERDSIVFYRSFFEGIDKLPQRVQVEAYRAIFRYAFYREDPGELSPSALLAFTMAKPQIDANFQRFVNGFKGGAPKGNKNASKQPKNNQKQPMVDFENNQKQPNVNVNVNENVNENENVNVPPAGGVGGTSPPRSVFKPPTIDEVRDYCRERGNNVDPDAWWNFYESKGWMIGKNKMKNWKAAVSTWERDGRSGSAKNEKNGDNGNGRDYDRRRGFIPGLDKPQKYGGSF